MTEDYLKVPQASLFYQLDWSDWLKSGDTIVSSVWVVPTGITNVTSLVEPGNKITSIKLTGGTVGEAYIITNRITTALSAEVEERSFIIRVIPYNDI